MPWFPEFANAAQLAREEARAAGQADPVGEYLAALRAGDTRILEKVWPGEVVAFGRTMSSAATWPRSRPTTPRRR
jgi:hypothetical protein